MAKETGDALDDFEDLMSRNYQYAVIRKGREFVVSIPELNVFGSATTIEGAYELVEAGKADLFRKYIDLDLAGRVPTPQPSSRGDVAAMAPASVTLASDDRIFSGSEFGRFAIKGLIVIAFVGIFFVIAGLQAQRMFAGGASQMFSSLAKSVAENVRIPTEWTKVGIREALALGAKHASSLTKERKDEMTTNLHILVRSIQPFADELHPLFTAKADRTPPPAQKKPPGMNTSGGIGGAK